MGCQYVCVRMCDRQWEQLTILWSMDYGNLSTNNNWQMLLVFIQNVKRCRIIKDAECVCVCVCVGEFVAFRTLRCWCVVIITEKSLSTPGQQFNKSSKWKMGKYIFR